LLGSIYFLKLNNKKQKSKKRFTFFATERGRVASLP
jgi:hypothetical protein